MELLAVAAVTAIVSVFMWEYFKRNVPYWRMRMEQITRGEPDEMSWKAFPRTEFTVSRNGVTRTYASLEEMPESDRKHFLDAKRQIEEARKAMAENNPFFQRGDAPDVFKTATGKTIPRPAQRPKTNRDLN